MKHLDVDDIPVGPELDALIAERVMGLHSAEEPKPYSMSDDDTEIVWRDKDGYRARSTNYSTDIATAWLVVEYFQKNWFIEVGNEPQNWNCAMQRANEIISVEAETAPLAICRAALKASINPQPTSVTIDTME